MKLESIRYDVTNSVVKIEKGELVSYQFKGIELMHQKGTPGWRNTDTEMFPLIGPTAENNFKVETPKGTCIQDQHGLLRELEYKLINKTENRIQFEKRYKANTPVKNSKFPDKSPEAFLSWPYDFSFLKSYELSAEGLKVIFEVNAAEDMPFMLGYHPAFKLSGDLNEIIATDTKSIAIEEVIAVGDTAFPVLHTNTIRLKKDGELDIEIVTKGFDNYMLWAPVPTMVCIEPITAYPYVAGGIASGNLFQKLLENNSFEVVISPS